MDKVIIIRYGELYLKGKNRDFFENALKKNIKYKLSKFDCKINFGRSRYVVSEFSYNVMSDIIRTLKQIFGIHSLSAATQVNNVLEDIEKASEEFLKGNGSFKVVTNRADKKFPLTSVEISKEIGHYLLQKYPSLNVDLFKPDYTINIDLRENGKAYVFSDIILGAGGMPVGTAGRGLLLLSGGIDSPVAGYMMAKRGLSLDALHFHSYPYTSELAKQKVIDLREKLENYCGKINLISIKFTAIQEAIHKYCESKYMITIMRRCMMKIAEKIALSLGLGCLVNGESLGQVASQTLESIMVTNNVVTSVPVFRPLIGMDKQEIIEISNNIETYSISIRPYEDCCTVFLPDNPVTHPKLDKVLDQENKILDLEELLDEAINQKEIF